MPVVQAKKATAFLDTVGVNIHVGYNQYSNLTQVISILQDIGFKYVRDGGRFNISKLKTVGAAGIKILYITNPFGDGTVPNSSYVITKEEGPEIKRSIVDTTITKWDVPTLVSNIGAGILTGLEGLNEIDLNMWKYRWSQSDQTPLSTVDRDYTSTYSWVNYVHKYNVDMNAALKADPNSNGLLYVAASLGGTYTYNGKNPMQEISDHCDVGNGHYYENGGNGFNDKRTINNLTEYYARTSFPGNLAGRRFFDSTGAPVLTGGEDDNSDLLRACYEQPFAPKPMYITECGWHTGGSKHAINFNVHGKYVPRMYVEYFRLGFARSYWYELIDQGTYSTSGTGDRENTFGLIRRDLVYKPGAVQLKTLMGILADASDTRSTVGSLDYSLTYTMPTGYTKPNFVKQVLLQKSNGTFVLLVYNNSACSDVIGDGVSVEIVNPNIAATLTLPKAYNVKRTTLRSDTTAATPVTTNNVSTVNFNITDTVTAFEISEVTTTPVINPPAGYSLSNIGANSTGSFTVPSTGVVDLVSKNEDVWGTADSFSFFRKSITGDGQAKGRIESVSSANTNSKVGVMIRETLNADSRFIAMFFKAGGGLEVHTRATTGGTVSSVFTNTTVTIPEFLEVRRVGSTITCSTSEDNATFTTRYTLSNSTYASSCFIGYFSCSNFGSANVTSKITVRV